MNDKDRFMKSLDELRGALSYEKEARENAFFAAGIAKSFEYLQTMHRYLAEATRLYEKHFS